MRVRVGLALLCAITASTAYPAAKADPPKVKRPILPTAGIKTPGVQIPFASLKPEVDLPAPAKPAWLFFSESLYVPNGPKGVVDKLEAKTGKAAEPIPGVANACARMGSGFSSLWVPDCASGSLLRLETKTLKQTAKIATSINPVAGALAFSADSVWLLSDGKTTLSRIDPEQNLIVADVRVPAGCKNLTFGENALWLLCPAQNHLLHIDPATNLITKRITVSADPQSLAIGEGSIWVLSRKEGKVERIDPKTDKVIKTIELSVPAADGEIAVGEGSVWVTMAGFPLTRISPTADKEKVVQQFYGTGGGVIQITTGSLWLSNVTEGTLWRIDPKRVAATLAE